ncbi:MAG: MvaI/BcnI family restriction endonuclease, partial [Nitrosarchaeum sp.]
MSKTLPVDTNYTKKEIKKIICDIKQRSWLPLPPKWADKDGGGGEYIQYDHFHVKVNPQKVGDLGSYELKTHRSKGNSLVTLGSIDPKDENKGSLLHPLLLSYGFPYKDGNTKKFVCRDRKAGKNCKHAAFHYPNGLCYPDDEISLGVDICGKDVFDSPQNKWGFYLEINREKKRVFMH